MSWPCPCRAVQVMHRACGEYQNSKLVSKYFLGNEQGFEAQSLKHHKNKQHVNNVEDSKKTKTSIASICSKSWMWKLVFVSGVRVDR